jgi:hypothetical protein
MDPTGIRVEQVQRLLLGPGPLRAVQRGLRAVLHDRPARQDLRMCPDVAGSVRHRGGLPRDEALRHPMHGRRARAAVPGLSRRPVRRSGAPRELAGLRQRRGRGRYSPLSQIDRENVGRLRVAWIYRAGGADDRSPARQTSAFEATPIMVDRTHFLSTPFNRVIALDPETGAEQLGLPSRRRSGADLRAGHLVWRQHGRLDPGPELVGKPFTYAILVAKNPPLAAARSLGNRTPWNI